MPSISSYLPMLSFPLLRTGPFPGFMPHLPFFGFGSTDFSHDLLCGQALEPCELPTWYTMESDNCPLPRINPLPTVQLGGRGSYESLPIHDWWLIGRVSHRPSTGNHSCCELIFARAMSCPDNSISCLLSYSSDIPSVPSAVLLPKPQRDRSKYPV